MRRWIDHLIFIIALSFTFGPDGIAAQPIDRPPGIGGDPVDGRRVALIIGNSDYPDGSNWSDLPNAANDAAYIARLLEDPARGEARFETVTVQNGTQEDLLAALERFGGLAEEAAVAVVYYSGHGFQFADQNYIVPIDAPQSVSQNDLAMHFVSMAEITGAASADGFNVYFLDACRSPGPVVARSSYVEGNPAPLFGAIEAPQSVVFYATSMGDVAYDAAPEDSPLSPFATAVGQAISYPGLDVPYVFGAVRDAVLRATEIYSPKQQPVFTGSWSRPFYFVPASMQDFAPVAVLPGGASARLRLGPTRSSETPASLDIPLEMMSTLDENILIVRVLERYRAEQILAMAEGGDPVAQYLAGYMYGYGAGLPEDHEQARHWLERAAASGHPAGQLELGYFLTRYGEPDERSRAVELVRAAADQGYAKAMSHLGAMMFDPQYAMQDEAEATRLYRAAAERGHAWAHYALSLRREDVAGHIAALSALAEAGNDEGHNWLCELSFAGFPVERSFDHCLAASRAGYTVPRAIVAMRYAEGDGVEANEESAEYWARMAAESFDISPVLDARMQAILAD
ncbi:caspase family protein [uncultured Parasphingopyxis sp.]|uniref:caspase family protein n=1 Tax=uncultured Parasphingopyxis sp. TaxID=1547918 RepID=UPI002633C654|nr:caspase family protein [uncultured Parasphingopyxis sp.]